MKTRTALATSLFALASSPLWAQQPSPANQQDSPAAQQSPSSTAPAPSYSSSATPAAPTAPMSPVNGELTQKLDSKTAKNGDSVVVQTKTSVKTPDGTEIPKGSKLVGHVMGVLASTEGQNSQVALQFDHVELQGGQSVPVLSQIQSITPPEGAASAGSSASSVPPGDPRATPGSTSPGATSSGAAGNGDVAAGTIVAKSGSIAIRTTSVPGVLLANNAPGQQDPRMGQASSILLGAKKDIQLDGGTQMVLGVSPAAAGTH
jgi:hypothetical protein